MIRNFIAIGAIQNKLWKRFESVLKDQITNFQINGSSPVRKRENVDIFSQLADHPWLKIRMTQSQDWQVSCPQRLWYTSVHKVWRRHLSKVLGQSWKSRGRRRDCCHPSWTSSPKASLPRLTLMHRHFLHLKVWKWKCESKNVKVKVWKCESESVKVKVWKWKCESES